MKRDQIKITQNKDKVYLKFYHDVIIKFYTDPCKIVINKKLWTNHTIGNNTRIT